MPWTEARAYLSVVERYRGRRLLETAVAMRAAQSDEAGWEKWCRLLEE